MVAGSAVDGDGAEGRSRAGRGRTGERSCVATIAQRRGALEPVRGRVVGELAGCSPARRCRRCPRAGRTGRRRPARRPSPQGRRGGRPPKPGRQPGRAPAPGRRSGRRSGPLRRDPVAGRRRPGQRPRRARRRWPRTLRTQRTGWAYRDSLDRVAHGSAPLVRFRQRISITDFGSATGPGRPAQPRWVPNQASSLR